MYSASDPIPPTRRHAVRGAIVALVLTASGEARAEEDGADVAADVAIAAALLHDGEALARRGALREAVDKLDASVRADPTPQALIALGDCQDALGKTASAWGSYHRAEERARLMGDAPHAGDAATRLEVLTPRLARVRIVVTTDSATPSVRLDRRTLSQSAWGTPIPVDPGKHTVVASAPGRRDYTAQIDVPLDWGTQTVSVPPLAEIPPPTPVRRLADWSPPSPRRHLDSRALTVAAFTFGGIGFTAGVAGIIVAYSAGGAKGAKEDLLLGTGLGMTFGGAAFVGIGYALARVADKHKAVSAAPPPVQVTALVARGGGGPGLGFTW